MNRLLETANAAANATGYQRAIRIRVRATGQVIEMVPDVARAMILGGTAEEVKSTPETMTLAGAETAVAPPQPASRKPILARGRKS
jgi:hypothetical protein